MNIRRSSLSAHLLAILLAAVLCAGTVQAKLPEQQRIPADAIAAAGIPDTAAFWSKVSNLSLAQSIDAFLASPLITADPVFQNFSLERAKLEQQLGFPVTAAEIMGNVFSSALIYAIPAAEPQGSSTAILLLGVKDKAKAAKLVEFADKNAVTTSPSNIAFEKLTLGGVPVSQVTVKSDNATSQTTFYTVAGDRFILTTSRSAMEDLLANKAPAQSLDQNPVFAKLAKALPWDASDAALWFDGAALVGAGKLGQLFNNPMLGMMGQQPKPEEMKGALTLEIKPEGIVGIGASTANPLTPGGPQPRKLVSLNYMPATPIFSVAYGLLDAAKTYQQVSSMVVMMSMMGAMKGGQGAPSNPITEAEQTLGISFQNDLVPALGNEAMLALNSIQFNPMASMIPSVDAVIGIEVRDEAKMKTIMGKMEKLVEEKLAGMGGTPGQQGGEAIPPKFSTVAGTPIRTIATNTPFSPSYALTDKYLLIGLNSQGVQAALARFAGSQTSAAKSPGFTSLTGLAGTDNIYGYSVVDLGQASETIIKPLLAWATLSGVGQIPPAQMQQATEIVTKIMPRMGAMSSIDTVKDGLPMGYMELKIPKPQAQPQQ